ncbi:MAG: amino acid adenylation domain-containing protein [Lachnospiraceae bacterium]|nr:amino acid adenylation domain-containing protein [Lachnospiraceae bacterium]
MKNVLEYLEHSAGSFGSKTAVIDDQESCTYEKLLNVSQQAGLSLTSQIEPGAAVAVMMKKSVCTLQMFFAITYAGGFYSLIDPGFPADRIQRQLSVLTPRVVITLPEYADKLREAGYTGTVLMADALRSAAAADIQETSQSRSGLKTPSFSLPKALSEIRNSQDPAAPLYCNFTSGSTGIPKGVLVGHDSVIAFIDAFTDLFSITDEDVIGNQAPFDFDVSVKDIFSAIKTGATLVIIPTAYFRFPNQVMDMLCEHKVTTLIWAVSALVLLNRLHMFLYKVPPCINKILFSGEEMPAKHLADWKAQYPDALFVNLYGPTEITCNCTYHIIDKDYAPGEKIPIGTAYPGKQILLLDETDNLITPDQEDVTGELCVSGSGLAIGYYHNPEATDRAFIQYPDAGGNSVRVYRTGDLAYYHEGLLYFAGRKDFQIKHNGHRIELEEIERCINALDQVQQACCIYDEEKYRLIAFYTGCEDQKAIIEQLKKKLPEYMIPNRFRYLEQLPLTKNGKVDRKLLKTM